MLGPFPRSFCSDNDGRSRASSGHIADYSPLVTDPVTNATGYQPGRHISAKTISGTSTTATTSRSSPYLIMSVIRTLPDA